MLRIKIIATLAPVFINYILLYNRNEKWVKSKYKWYLVLVLATISLFGFPVNSETISSNDKFLAWSWITPLIFSILDFIFMKISYSIHNRDFYLWLFGFSEKTIEGKKIRTSDKIFHMLLTLLSLFLPLSILFFI